MPAAAFKDAYTECMKERRYGYSIILEPQECGGFTVLVPDLPEVVTEGETKKEALANAGEAIRAVLAFRRDRARRNSNV